MSRLTNTLGTINWQWFINAKQLLPSVVLTDISTINSILNTLVFTDQERTQLYSDVDTLIYYMTGIDPDTKKDVSSEKWYNTWLSQSHSTQFASNVNFIRNSIMATQTIDTNSFVTSMNNISAYILYKFFSTPIPVNYDNAGNFPLIVNNTSNYYTLMTDYLYKFFYNNGIGIGGIGNDTIQDMCQYFTRDQITASPDITKWCGCFSPNSTLTDDALKTAPEAQSYQKQCDPLCINPKSIKIVYNENDSAPYTNKICDSTICILGPENIQNTDSTGTINFSQICPCASGAQACFCIVDSTIEDILNKTTTPDGGSLAFAATFNQYCPNAQCYISTDGVLSQVQCNTENPSSTSLIERETAKKKVSVSNDLWILVLLLLAAGILFVLCARHIGYEPKYKVQGILNPSASLSKSTNSRTIHNYV